MSLPIVRTKIMLENQVQQWRKAGLRIGLVPTMGALHKGHLSLVDTISQSADKVVISIFVNPTQFGVGEDLQSYPRCESQDAQALEDYPCDLIYAPSVTEMYPHGVASSLTVTGITDDLEGAKRPGHFNGMATVVNTLFEHCAPDMAIFGEKDYQQLLTIRQFVRDLNIPVEIIGGALLREEDGLAMSSRNAYLSADERNIANKLNVILTRMISAVKAGKPIKNAEKESEQALLKVGFTAVDYITIRDAHTLAPLTTLDRPARALAVARIRTVRLLDNMPITN